MLTTIYIYKIADVVLNNNHSLCDSMGIVTYKITLVHLLNLQQLFEFWNYSNKTKRHEKQWLMLYFYLNLARMITILVCNNIYIKQQIRWFRTDIRHHNERHKLILIIVSSIVYLYSQKYIFRFSAFLQSSNRSHFGEIKISSYYKLLLCLKTDDRSRR